MRGVVGWRWLGPAFAALLALSGCASIEGANRLQGIKTVGIISAIGDKFTFTSSGLTGFDNAPRSVSIEAWGIDEQVVARAIPVLSQRFQVQPVTFQRELFFAPERVSSIPGVDLVREDPVKELVIFVTSTDVLVGWQDLTSEACEKRLREIGVTLK